jgi:hypothetical protein
LHRNNAGTVAAVPMMRHAQKVQNTIGGIEDKAHELLE